MQKDSNAYYFPGLEAGMGMNIGQLNSLLHAMGFPSASTSMTEGETSSSPMFHSDAFGVPQVSPICTNLDPVYMHTDQATEWLHSSEFGAAIAANTPTEDVGDDPIQVDEAACVGQPLDLSASNGQGLEHCEKDSTTSTI